LLAVVAAVAVAALVAAAAFAVDGFEASEIVPVVVKFAFDFVPFAGLVVGLAVGLVEPVESLELEDLVA